MSNPFGWQENAPGKIVTPEKMVLLEKALIVYDAIRKAGAEGVDNQQLLKILCQYGLVDVPDGYETVWYKISEWDESPEYDAEYEPKYRRLSVYDSDDLNDAKSLLAAKGLIRYDKNLKRWFVSTPDRAWEKSLRELLDVKLLKIPVKAAKEQIQHYQQEAANAEVFALGYIDVMSAFGSHEGKYKSRHQQLALADGHSVDLSVSFEESMQNRQKQIKIELSSPETDELLLAIEAPEGTLRDLIKLEAGKEMNLPISELGFDPTETGLAFRVLTIPTQGGSHK